MIKTAEVKEPSKNSIEGSKVPKIDAFISIPNKLIRTFYSREFLKDNGIGMHSAIDYAREEKRDLIIITEGCACSNFFAKKKCIFVPGDHDSDIKYKDESRNFYDPAAEISDGPFSADLRRRIIELLSSTPTDHETRLRKRIENLKAETRSELERKIIERSCKVYFNEATVGYAENVFSRSKSRIARLQQSRSRIIVNDIIRDRIQECADDGINVALIVIATWDANCHRISEQALRDIVSKIENALYN